MSRTINGKAVSQVITELIAPFPKEEIKDNPAGFPYLPYEAYRKRLDTVVGVFNYDYVVTQTDWITIGEKTHISCIGTLSIRDDNGNVVTIKSATGDADVITRNIDGAAVKSGNDAKTADHDAFKSCCRMLGIGDAQLRAMRNGKKSNGSGGSGSSVKEEEIRVLVCGEFKPLGGKGYKAPAVIKETGEQVALILWKEGVEAVQKYMKLADFFKAYKNKEFTVVGTRNRFNGNNGKTEEQVIMLRPHCAKEAS